MSRADKAAAIAELSEKFKSSNAAVLTEYRGLTVKQITDLRNSLRGNATYAVVKNTLTELAAAGHEVAYHGWCHEDWAELDPGREAELLERGVRAMDALGLRPDGFRPPGGRLTTATLGLFLSLLVILGTRTLVGEAAFAEWGWRVPFLVSVILLAISVWIRLSMNESPAFKKMKEEGKTSKAPLTESFGQWKNLKIVILALVVCFVFLKRADGDADEDEDHMGDGGLTARALMLFRNRPILATTAALAGGWIFLRNPALATMVAAAFTEKGPSRKRR